MRNVFLTFCLSLVFTQSVIVSAGIGICSNLTEFRRHRQRRGLIFTNGGTIKFSIGASMPVPLADPGKAWRSLVCSYALQGGHYTIPTEPLYPWDKWEDTYARSIKQMKSKFERYGEYEPDGSREFVYTLFENYMNRNNANGHQCLLRAICENAQVRQHEDVYAQVLNVLLTPGKENLDKSYTMALRAGRYGADCWKLYYLCPKGSSILDQYINEIPY